MNIAAKILVDCSFKGATMVGMDGYMNPAIYIGRESIAVDLGDTEQADAIEGWLNDKVPELWEASTENNELQKDRISFCLDQIT